MVNELSDEEEDEEGKSGEEKREDKGGLPSLPLSSSSSSFSKGLELYDIFFLSLVRRLLTKLDGKDKDR